MTPITIPRAIVKDKELVAMPRKEYEDYLRLRKVIPVIKMTPDERKNWKRAKKEYVEGKYVTLEQVQYELGLIANY